MEETRSFTPTQISEIVAETVETTVKDMKHVADIVRLVAEVTQELTALLSHDRHVVIDRVSGARGGMTAEKSLAWRAAVALKERAA